MFNYVVSFWHEILAVFLNRSGSPYPVALYAFWNAGSYHSEQGFGQIIYIDQFERLLAFGTLLALCIFLFYQVYKVIHAFVGGFYEDAY